MEKRSLRDRLENSMALLSSLNTPIHKARCIDKPDNERNTSEGKRESLGAIHTITSRPYDYEAYMARVHTFNSLQWMAKPVWLSPMECARYGWENTDVDILHCISCDAHISGRIPDSFQIDVYGECVSRIAASLCSGHREVCPWFSSCCPEYFMEVPLQDTATAVTLFTKLVRQLSQIGEALPLITRSQTQTMGFVDKHLEQLFRLADYSDNGEDSGESLSAVVLATCGWNAGSQSKADLINCTLCSRNVGLWNFTNLCKEKGEYCPPGQSVLNSPSDVCTADLTPGEKKSKKTCQSAEDSESQVVPMAEGYDSNHDSGMEETAGPPQQEGVEDKIHPSDEQNLPNQDKTTPMETPLEVIVHSVNQAPSNSNFSSEDPQPTKEDVGADLSTGISDERTNQDLTDNGSEGHDLDQDVSNKEDLSSQRENSSEKSLSECVPEDSSNLKESLSKARVDWSTLGGPTTDSQHNHDIDTCSQEPLEVKVFDPVAEHRHWCPWVVENLSPQNGSNQASSLPSSPPNTHPNRARYLRSPARGDRTQAGWKHMLDLLVPRLSPEKKQINKASRPEAVRRALSLVSSPIPRKLRRLTTKTTP